MSTLETRDLADALVVTPHQQSDLSVSTATVTAVGATTATITLGGKSIAGVPFYRTATPIVGNIVDVLFVGATPRIIGAY